MGAGASAGRVREPVRVPLELSPARGVQPRGSGRRHLGGGSAAGDRPHEHRPGDKNLTRYFLKSCDAFITMSEKVLQDLRLFEQHKSVRLVQHPLYDNFGERINKWEARKHLKIDEK